MLGLRGAEIAGVLILKRPLSDMWLVAGILPSWDFVRAESTLHIDGTPGLLEISAITSKVFQGFS